MKPARKFARSSRSSLMLLSAILLSGVSFMAGAQGKSVDTTMYTLSGILTDEQHQPLDYVSIQVLCGGVLVGGAKTREDGRFVIRVPMPVVDLRVQGLGYRREEIPNVQLPLDLRLCLRKKEPHEIGELKMSSRCYNPFFHPSEPGRKVIYAEDLRHMGY